MTKTKRSTKTSVDEVTSGITKLALAGAGATIATGLGAGIAGAIKAKA